MSYRFAFTFLGAVLLLAGTGSTKAAEILFEINTVALNKNGTYKEIIPWTEFRDVSRIGEGDKPDIKCEGISNYKGVLKCILKNCRENDPFTSYYHINFKSPTIFGYVNPAIINVYKCVVDPKPATAGFVDRVVLNALIEEDQRFVFGKTSDGTLSKMAEGASLPEYSVRIDTMLDQPLGNFRAANIRRFVQDASIISLKQNDYSAAIVYKNLATAHANTLLKKYSVATFGTDGVALLSPGKISTLNRNVNLILQNPNSNSAAQMSNPLFSKYLKELSIATQEGRLANTEFRQLEVMAGFK